MRQPPEPINAQAARIDHLMPLVLRRICTLEGPRVELPVAQLRLCSLLMQGPTTITALSRELGTTVSATTQLADRLEGIGFVERVAGEGDRRSRSLRLTRHGSDVMTKSREKRLARWSEVIARLPPASREALISLLDALALACSALPPGEGPQDALAGRAAEILVQVERS
ncbi:MAG: MarR family transcriptional regulator [Proteobacteria bacterium]|nr:MarR family transcriptional regulator [Pseudomonadota bacterium]